MSNKIFKPKRLEGREYERWILNVSTAIGVDPPATLEELGEISIVPIMSRMAEMQRQIDALTRLVSSKSVRIHELERKIDAIERSI